MGARVMDLVHIEHTTATSDDARLGMLLQTRARAVEQCLLANQHAGSIKADLIEHLRRRLEAGDDRSVLRKAMLDAGVSIDAVTMLLRAAGAA